MVLFRLRWVQNEDHALQGEAQNPNERIHDRHFEDTAPQLHDAPCPAQDLLRGVFRKAQSSACTDKSFAGPYPIHTSWHEIEIHPELLLIEEEKCSCGLKGGKASKCPADPA